MLIINDYLWLASQNGVKIYNAASKQQIGIWATSKIVTAMILVPSGHCSDNEALVMITKSCSIAIFTNLKWTGDKSLHTVEPVHKIKTNCDLFCALLVPTINHLWICTSDSKLVVFKPGCYDNPEKYKMSDVSNPCCMAVVNEFVLVASQAKIQKWDTVETPCAVCSLECEATVMEKITTFTSGKSLVGSN